MLYGTLFWLSNYWSRAKPIVSVQGEGSTEVEVYRLVADLDSSYVAPWKVVLGIHPTVPDKHEIGSGFLINVEFIITSVMNSDGTQLNANDKFAMQEIRGLLSYMLMATLNIAGMTVEPDGPTSVSQDLKTSWSVIGTSAGDFVGVMKARMYPVVPTMLGPRIELPGDLKISIGIQKPPPLPTDVAAIIVAGLGGLVSLSMLVKFIWDWRDRGIKLKNEAEKKQPKIYTPR